MYWVWENYVTGVLNVRKFCKRSTESEKFMLEMHWLWEKYVRDVLNLWKLRNRYTDCEKTM